MNTVRAVRGFTLVELIVVIAIIMLLSAMLFPVFETVMARAEGTSCLNNMRNLGLANRLYADDYDGTIVPASVGGPPGYFGTCWDVLLQNYMRNQDILICPSDENPVTSVPGRMSLTHSYGINFDLAFVGGYNGSSLRLCNVEQPAQTILFCEIQSRYRSFGMSYAQSGLERLADNRHESGSNYTFLDGHGKLLRPRATVSPDNLWDP